MSGFLFWDMFCYDVSKLCGDRLVGVGFSGQERSFIESPEAK